MAQQRRKSGLVIVPVIFSVLAAAWCMMAERLFQTRMLADMQQVITILQAGRVDMGTQQAITASFFSVRENVSAYLIGIWTALIMMGLFTSVMIAHRLQLEQNKHRD